MHPDGLTAAMNKLIGCDLSASEHSWLAKAQPDEES